MGLFSSKKKTIVSSAVYSLAGDIDDRPVYKRDFLLKYILKSSGGTYTDTMVQGYLNGPGIKYRRFAKWANESGYTSYVGQRGTGIFEPKEINNEEVISQIPHNPVTEEVMLNTSEIDVFDYMYWAEEYVLKNYPNAHNTEWKADINSVTDEITITFTNGTKVKFFPVNFNGESRYLYARYHIISNEESQESSQGSFISLVPGSGFNTTEGWRVFEPIKNIEYTAACTTSVTTKTEYSDSTPTEQDTVETTLAVPYQETIVVYSQELNPVLTGSFWEIKTLYRTDKQTFIKKPKQTQLVTENEVNGVTITKTITTNSEELLPRKSYKIDSSTRIFKDISLPKLIIYEQNSGNEVLDSQFSTERSLGTYLPIIPIAYQNKLITSGGYYNRNVKAFKKAFNDSYDTFIDNMKDGNGNPAEGVDFGFVVFGVSLNTRSEIAKKYLYQFFKYIHNEVAHTTGSYLSWRDEYNKSVNEWREYRESIRSIGGHIISSGRKPPKPIPTPPNLSISVTGKLNYNMKIKIQDVVLYTGSGMYDSKIKVGETKISYGGNESFYYYTQNAIGNTPFVTRSYGFSVSTVNIIHQETETLWRRYQVFGLEHINTIYRGKSVVTTAQDVFSRRSNEKFIIPIQMDIFNSLNLLDATQLTTECSYIVLNSYERIKTGGFFSSGFFKIIVFVVIIIISVYSGGAGAGAGGALGTNAAVGAAIGFTGTAAIVAGAVANAVAAMVINQILSVAASAVFGDEIGGFIALIASAYAVQAGNAMSAGQSLPTLSTSLGTMMDPKNLTKLSMGVANEYSKTIHSDTQDIMNKTENLLSDYQKQSEEISKMYDENFGSNLDIFNPLTLTDPFMFFGGAIESSDEFMNRTLLVGSDLANISNAYISEFANITLNTNLQ